MIEPHSDHEPAPQPSAGHRNRYAKLTTVGSVAMAMVFTLVGAKPAPTESSFIREAVNEAAADHPASVPSRSDVSPGKNDLEAMRALLLEGRRLNRASRRDETAVQYERLLEMANANNAPNYSYAAYWALAAIHRRDGASSAAIDSYEKALSHLNEYKNRGHDVTQTGWRMLHGLMECHLSRGSVAMAQMAHWRAEESAVEYLTDQHPQFAAEDFYTPASWHDHIVRDLFSYVQILVNEASFSALRGDLSGSNALLLETAKLLEERGRTHCDERLLARNYTLLSAGLEREGRLEERDAAVDKLLAMKTCGCIGPSQHIENLRRIERAARAGGDPDDWLREVGALVDTMINGAFETFDTKLVAQGHLAHRLAGAGRLSGAIEMMDGLIAKAEEAELFRTLARLRHERAILLLDHGLTDGVETSLFAALDFYRQNGLILEEADAYREYVRYLIQTQRHDEALPVFTLALQRADRFGWVMLKAELLELFDESKRAVANRPHQNGSPEIRSTIAMDAAGFLDLQPIQMVSRAESGEWLRGRFTLTNTGIADVEGTLEIDGPVLSNLSNSSNGTWAVAIGPGGAPDSRVLILAPGERKIVYLEAEGSGEASNDISLRWISEGEMTQDAWWTYGVTAGSETITVVQTSLAMDNPFYAVPFYHEIYRRTGETGPVDFRMRSSHPAYIEAVDVDTGRLLAIDASGNGRFDDIGDAVFRDTERNGFPDILFKTGEEVPAIELHVYPRLPEGSFPDEIIVELDIRLPGADWQTKARNRLVPGS